MISSESNDLGVRTKAFAVRVIRLVEALPKGVVGCVIGKQVLRSGTSVGAQYREAKRARSKAEFAAKVQGAVQELEETAYWIELMIETNLIPSNRLSPLLKELDEIMAMLVASIKTVKSKK